MSTAKRAGLALAARDYLRHPVIVAAGVASLSALVGLNVLAFIGGPSDPWLLGGVIIADMAVVGITISVSAREVLRARQRSEMSEARLEAIVDSAMDAIITIDEHQDVVLFNRAAEQMFRCSRDEAVGESLDKFLPQRFHSAHRALVEEFGRTGRTSRKMGGTTTLWAVRSDGQEFPIDASISQMSEGGRRYFTVILRDVTLRKQHEDEIQRSQEALRELSARVVEAREEEKAHIARELHDELGQLLSAIKMDLSSLRESPEAASPQLAAKVDEMEAMLDQTIATTRRITADLRPLMLDDLGLADAANWLVDDFSRRSGVTCSVSLTAPEALQSAPKTVCTTLYRALQESLTNIARHAAATSVRVRLAASDDAIELEIEDDGCGIAVADVAKPRSFGLRGMRERVTYLGGTFKVAPAAQGGTRVTVRIPYHATASASLA